MTKTLRIGAATALILLTAACARAAGNPASESANPTFPSDDTVVLRVEYVGGFTSPSVQVSRLPIITVYGDGRVITEGPQIMIFPGPALPNLQVRRIAPSDITKLTDRATAAGVGTAGDLGRPGITDVPDTRFTVRTSSGVKKLDVFALNEGAGHTSGLTPAQVAARQKLLDLMAALTDLPHTLGADKVSPSKPYEPVAVAAIASPWQSTGDGTAQPEVTWPGPKLPGDPIGVGLDIGCVVATGDAAAAVLKAAASANVITPWVSDGKRWTVAVRPLLPDEGGCSDLALDN
jgi:hypothetical protein